MSLLGSARAAARADDPGLTTPDQSFADQLVGLVPSEAVGALTAGVALAAGYGWGWGVRWAIFGAVAVVAAGWIWVSYWNALTDTQKLAKRLGKPWWALSTGLLAFTAWAATIPSTPFLEWRRWDLKFAPAVTLAAVVLITLANELHNEWRVRHPAVPAALPDPEEPLA